MTVASVVVPLFSVLLGAAMTYWLNVRSRKRNHIEDAFNEAVAAADASKSYLRHVSKPAEMSTDDYRACSLAWQRRRLRTTRSAVAKHARRWRECFRTNQP